MQPRPAAVTACRNTLSLTSPAAKTPGTAVAVEFGCGHDVAVGIERQLAGNQLGHRRVADRDKDAVAGAFGNGAGADIAQPDPGHLGRLGDAEDLVHDRIPDDVDLRVAEQPVLQNFLGPQLIAPVDQGDPACVVRQIDRFLDRGVAAADDDRPPYRGRRTRRRSRRPTRQTRGIPPRPARRASAPARRSRG